MSLCRSFYEQQVSAKRIPPVIVIITGQSGGRGVSFVCKEGLLHLSDMFLRVPDTAHGEGVVQQIHRLAGIYENAPLLASAPWQQKVGAGFIHVPF